MYKFYSFLVSFILLFSSLCFSQEHSLRDSLTQAEKFYDSGKYKEAVNLYEKIVEKKQASGAVFYNLGNSYYRMGNKGKAIAAYFAAKQTLPRDPDIKHNLNFVHESIKDKINLDDSGNFSAILGFWSEFITAKELKVFCLFASCLVLLILIISHFVSLPFAFSYIRNTLLVFSMISLFFWQSSLSLKKDWGAVSVEESKVLSGPGDYNTVLFKLHEGAPVVLEEKKKEWYKISLPGSKKGWIKSEEISYFSQD